MLKLPNDAYRSVKHEMREMHNLQRKNIYIYIYIRCKISRDGNGI